MKKGTLVIFWVVRVFSRGALNEVEVHYGVEFERLIGDSGNDVAARPSDRSQWSSHRLFLLVVWGIFFGDPLETVHVFGPIARVPDPRAREVTLSVHTAVGEVRKNGHKKRQTVNLKKNFFFIFFFLSVLHPLGLLSCSL